MSWSGKMIARKLTLRWTALIIRHTTLQQGIKYLSCYWWNTFHKTDGNREGIFFSIVRDYSVFLFYGKGGIILVKRGRLILCHYVFLTRNTKLGRNNLVITKTPKLRLGYKLGCKFSFLRKQARLIRQWEIHLLLPFSPEKEDEHEVKLNLKNCSAHTLLSVIAQTKSAWQIIRARNMVALWLCFMGKATNRELERHQKDQSQMPKK